MVSSALRLLARYDSVLIRVVPVGLAASLDLDEEALGDHRSVELARLRTTEARVRPAPRPEEAGLDGLRLDLQPRGTKLPGETAEGKVRQDDLIPVKFNVPAHELAVALFWEGNWSRYPTNDVDLILVAPNGAVNVDGATLASPERAVTNPTAGVWTALVNGFTINGRADEWTLRATADGVRLRSR